MLSRLAKHALRQGLSSQPGFSARNLHWLLEVSPGGDPLGMVDCCRLVGRKRTPHVVLSAPELPNALNRTGQRCHFLLESVAVVLNWPAKPSEQDKIARKHRFFLDLLQQAQAAEPRCKAVSTLLSVPDLLEKARQMARNEGVKTTDNICFSVDGQPLLELTSWRQWWTGFLSSLQNASSTADQAIDLLSGNPCTPAKTHPNVAGLSSVGGRATSFLISFDKAAFESFGLAQSANAPLSEESARTYVDALNYLVRNQSTPMGDMLVLHWFDGMVSRQDDPFSLLEDPPEAGEIDALDRVRELVRAIHSGQRPDLAGYRYFTMGISGSGARIMVRFWMEGSLAELAQRVEQWFDAIKIIRPDGSIRAAIPLRELAKTAVPAIESSRDSANLALRRLAQPLLRSALSGAPLPSSVAAAALDRLRAELFTIEKGRNELNSSHRPARMGLLRAFVNAFTSQKGASPLNPVTPDMDPNSPHAAYHCGRLMAALAEIQRVALPDVGAGVVQRYYAAASATPALVFGRLIRGAQYHLGKLEVPLARFFDQDLGEITRSIGQSMPATLDLEGQTLFALGYYHQLVSMRQRAKDRAAQRRMQENSSQIESQGDIQNA